jgi:hypothetical protein
MTGYRHLPEQRTQQLAAQLGVSADEFLAAQATAAARRSPASQAAAKAAAEKLSAAKAAAAGVAALDGLEQPGSSAAGSAEVDAAVQDPQQEVLAAADEAVLLGFVERLKTPVYAALNDLERAGQLQTVRVANATADEVIAAFVHLNARSSSPSRVVIKSGDKDFWQLGVYGEHAPIWVNTALIPTNFLVQQALNWPKCQKGEPYLCSALPGSAAVLMLHYAFLSLKDLLQAATTCAGSALQATVCHCMSQVPQCVMNPAAWRAVWSLVTSTVATDIQDNPCSKCHKHVAVTAAFIACLQTGRTKFALAPSPTMTCWQTCSCHSSSSSSSLHSSILRKACTKLLPHRTHQLTLPASPLPMTVLQQILHRRCMRHCSWEERHSTACRRRTQHMRGTTPRSLKL